MTRTVFLLDARDDFEAKLLEAWAEEQSWDAGGDEPASFVRISRNRSDDLSAALADTGDAWMQPLRIAWLPTNRPTRRISWQDLFYGRMTEPGATRRRWIAKRKPERIAYVAGDGALLTDLRERFNPTDADEDLSVFITNQALIALERSERTVRGARYKIPHISRDEVFANTDFRNLMANISQQQDRTLRAVGLQAGRYLEEMAASQTPFTIETMNAIYRTAVRSHHDAEIDVNDEQLQRVSETLSSRPVVFLISHKSMLDTMALSLVLFDHNLPLPLTFGGINLNKPGLGNLARRAGVIFLRRAFQDNEIYKATFRRYIDYLIEKRFSLLWALEGTRSRTGKLMPPRFGLFNYVLESILRTKLYDVTFIPVAVSYDQITEVEDYSIEQRGQKKKPEGITWPVRFLRRGQSRGQIHLRFGESLTIRDLVEQAELDAGIDEERKQILVPTLAFEVAVRMNAATPITATAIITLILLASGNHAMNLHEIQSLARTGATLIRGRRVEIVGRSNFKDEKSVLATLAELHETGIVSYLDEGTERLYTISADQHHNAAYYRNTAIHYWVLDAFVEVALLDAASSGGSRDALFARAFELREMFKFEFYLPRTKDYQGAIEVRANDRFENWEKAIEQGETATRKLLSATRLLIAHGTLRSFVDAYRVAASILATAGNEAVDNKNEFITLCLRTGKQEQLQGRVFSPESISKTLYETAWKLASYRGLLGANQEVAREAFHKELRDIVKRLDEILAIAREHAYDH